MQFLTIFQKTSLIRMLKTFNKARIRKPKVFYEEIKAVFKEEMTLKMTISKIPRYLTNLSSFCQTFDKFREIEY